MGHEAGRPGRVRGPYKPIAPTCPAPSSASTCRTAPSVADKYTILRSHSHNDNGHTTGYHYVMTGYRADFADGTNSRKPNNVLYPSLGSIVSRELGPRGHICRPTSTCRTHDLRRPGFYGAEHAPFVIESDPCSRTSRSRTCAWSRASTETRQRPPQPAARPGSKARRRKDAAGKAGTMATYYERPTT